MIATIILGFGLLMIGAVLPIAWKGALDAAAFTRAEGATQSAKYYIQKKCRVDGLRDLFNNITHDPLNPGGDGPDAGTIPGAQGVSYSFLGDYDTIDPDIDGDLVPDPLVHALHLENWAMDSSSLFILRTNNTNDFSVPEAPIVIEPPGPVPRTVGIPADLSVTVDPAYAPGIGAPVIKLRDRIFPPIPETLTPEDVNQWRDLLNSRRFAWAVLHKLARIPQSPTDPRYFHMYYVTLRRGNTTSRFARQDPASGIVPDAAPAALPDTEDVMFPVAWRVPLLVIESQKPGLPPSGVPAIAFAGAEDADVGPALAAGLDPPLAGSVPLDPVDNSVCKVADMFPRGAVFVDEQNGNVYQVMEREYLENAAGRTDRLAWLTLDMEVTISDLEDGLDNTPFVLEPANAPLRNRVVWVFPPSVSAGSRTAGSGGVKFTGTNPVVDIRVETLTLMP